ncbi:apolipoprotein L2-like [Rhineura floridana]|uniref:apolipoprotein L2-like n=1 Tax=Rhineura floridana TaxID=261503 RepID=UPI002AC87882|nr:apolipoprotein L2-like [Rhineura floridana]XP_061494998.1 apolipoprotein L2-like [Rhineura floridana]
MSEFHRNKGNKPSDLDEAVARFLKEFPAKREEIEKCIKCLLEMADDIDKTHKDCTIASITAGSTSAVSGVLNILGIALTPFTAGTSLILMATGLGLGLASGATSVSASVSERIIHSKDKKKAQELMNECEESLRMVLSLEQIGFNCKLPPHSEATGKTVQMTHTAVISGCHVANHIPKMIDQVAGIATHVEALECAKANPALKALAKQATAARSVARDAIKGIDQVDDAFKGTALAMSKGARVAGAALSGVFLAVDAYCIAKDATDLSKGAKTEKAAEIRAKADKLEEIVQNLNEFYEELRKVWD